MFAALQGFEPAAISRDEIAERMTSKEVTEMRLNATQSRKVEEQLGGEAISVSSSARSGDFPPYPF